MKGKQWLALLTIVAACDAAAEYNPAADKYFDGIRGLAPKPESKPERNFNLEVIRRPGSQVIQESFGDNIDAKNRLDYYTLNTHPLGENFEASQQAKEMRDDIADKGVNAVEDWAEYRLSHSRLMLSFMEFVHYNTFLDVDIENNQPGGPGTANEFSIDVGFDFRQTKKPLALRQATGNGEEKKKYELEWGLRFQGVNKPPALRTELLFPNGGRPKEYDFTLDLFEQEFEVSMKRQILQGTTFTGFFNYGEEQVGGKGRFRLNEVTALRGTAGWDYGSSAPFIAVSLEATFRTLGEVFWGKNYISHR